MNANIIKTNIPTAKGVDAADVVESVETVGSQSIIVGWSVSNENHMENF